MYLQWTLFKSTIYSFLIITRMVFKIPGLLCTIIEIFRFSVQGFFFAVQKKVLRKVNHFKVLEKRN